MADASPPSPECDDDEEPERKKRSTSNGEVLGLAIGACSHTVYFHTLELCLASVAEFSSWELLRIWSLQSLLGSKLLSRDGSSATCKYKMEVPKLRKCKQV